METSDKRNTVITIIGTALPLNRNITRRSSGKDRQVQDPGRETETILEIEEHQSKSNYYLGNQMVGGSRFPQLGLEVRLNAYQTGKSLGSLAAL